MRPIAAAWIASIAVSILAFVAAGAAPGTVSSILLALGWVAVYVLARLMPAPARGR